MPEEASPSPIALEARGLGHLYPDGVWAFRGIELSLRCGEIAVLAGRSGAGKSCLARHLAGLLAPTEGRIAIPGAEGKLGKSSFAPFVGYLFQDARLQILGERVLDDVLFGPASAGLEPKAALGRARDAILACGLGGKEEAFVHRLSGGEMRRLAIAGLLAMDPHILILDEPFANLDWAGVSAILGIVVALARRGIAVLVVTHEIEKVLALARVLVILDRGSIVASGEPRAVLARGIESYGLRDPLRERRVLEDLSWLS